MNEAKKPRRGKMLFLLVGAAVPIAAVVAGLSLRRSDELRHFTAEVQEGEIRDTVDSTGTVNAVINVQVGSQVSGTISRLNADFNSHVERGAVIALIDSQLFDGAFQQAAADRDSAEANVIVAEANLKRANAQLVQTKAEYQRSMTLTAKNLVSPSDLDLVKFNYEAASASVDAAVANVVQAKAQVGQKKAAVSVAQTNLDYTVIRSPIEGVVVARNVDVGQTVAASLQAPTIFTIAQDLTKMLVYAKVDESDVGRIRIRQPVTFKVDAFPKDQFKGAVREIRMNPTIVQNVVTYDTVIEFDNPELKLFPGMTAYVTIPVATVENVVKVPNGALRYKPPLTPDIVRGLYARYGIEEKTAAAPGTNGRGAPHGGTGPRGSARDEVAVVWRLLPDNGIQPVKITLGITDHTFTEVTGVVAGALKAGDEVVTSSVLSKTLGPGAQGIRR